MQYIFPITAPEAIDANRFGPKAANVARLGQAGFPIPAGFCLDAAAYLRDVLPALHTLGEKPTEDRLAVLLPDAWAKRQ